MAFSLIQCRLIAHSSCHCCEIRPGG